MLKSININGGFIDHIKSMRHSPVHNYVIPGLTSWLIGEPGSRGQGCIRLFEMSRTHEEPICAHTHRFDFQCLVLDGAVNNHLWCEHPGGDEFMVSKLDYLGNIGYHQRLPIGIKRFARRRERYDAGESYSMSADEYHSIYFDKGAMVLFFEGPQIRDSSHVLEPHVDGMRIPTFKTEPWMFRRES